jgi:hypothetical protein
MDQRKPLRQLCLDFGQRGVGVVRCAKCGMVYHHQTEDEATHRRHCSALQAAAMPGGKPAVGSASEGVTLDPIAAFEAAFRALACTGRAAGAQARSAVSGPFAVAAGVVVHVVAPPVPHDLLVPLACAAAANREPHLGASIYANVERANALAATLRAQARASAVPDLGAPGGSAAGAAGEPAPSLLALLGDARLVVVSRSEGDGGAVLGAALVTLHRRFVPTAIVEAGAASGGAEHGAADSQPDTARGAEAAEGERSRSPSPVPCHGAVCAPNGGGATSPDATVAGEGAPLVVRGVTVHAVVLDAVPFPAPQAPPAVNASRAAPAVVSVAQFFGARDKVTGAVTAVPRAVSLTDLLQTSKASAGRALAKSAAPKPALVAPARRPRTDEAAQPVAGSMFWDTIVPSIRLLLRAGSSLPATAVAFASHLATSDAASAMLADRSRPCAREMRPAVVVDFGDCASDDGAEAAVAKSASFYATWVRAI